MFLLTWFISSIIINSNANNMILNESLESTNELELTKAIVDLISNFYSKYSSNVDIFTASSDANKGYQIDNVINKILKEINFNIPIQLTDHHNINENQMRSSSSNSFIFFADTYRAFSDIFEQVEILFPFNYQGYFTIVLINEFPDEKSKMMDIFKRMWSKYIINVNLIFHESLGDNSNRISMYTYIPFSPANCGKTTPYKINEFFNGNYVIKDLYFPTKTSNFYGCKIKVATFNIAPMMLINQYSNGSFELKGIDGMLIKEMAEKLNFTIDLLHVLDENRWGIMYANGTSTGAMKLVNFTPPPPFLRRSLLQVIFNLIFFSRSHQEL